MNRFVLFYLVILAFCLLSLCWNVAKSIAKRREKERKQAERAAKVAEKTANRAASAAAKAEQKRDIIANNPPMPKRKRGRPRKEQPAPVVYKQPAPAVQQPQTNPAQLAQRPQAQPAPAAQQPQPKTRTAAKQETPAVKPTQKPRTSGAFAGQVVSFTGTLAGLTRSQAIEAVQKHGGKAFDTMPATTTLLVVGKKPGMNKLGKADRWITQVRKITEAQFMQMLDAPETFTLQAFAAWYCA